MSPIRRLASALVLMCAAARAYPGEPPKAAPARYEVPGASVLAPGGSGWTVQKSDAGVSFRRTDGAAAEDASLSSFGSPVFDDAQKFLVWAEKRKEAELGRMVMQSVHFNHTTFLDVPCIRYDGIFRDKTANPDDPVLMRPLGYVCRHPSRPGRAVEIVFARTADEKSCSPATMAVGDAFLKSLTFTTDFDAPLVK